MNCKPRSIYLFLLIFLMGCGTGAYEEKFKASLTKLKNESPFRELLVKPEDFDQSVLALRLPKLFQQKTYALDEKTSDPRDLARPLDENRVQPDFLHLPGYRRTYETFVTIKGTTGTWPMYCYVAVTDAKTSPLAKLETEIGSKLLEKFGEYKAPPPPKGKAGKPQRPSGVSEWESIELQTLDGSTIELKRIDAFGDQDFQYYAAGDVVKTRFLPGQYSLYLYSDGKYHVMIAWRAMHGVAEKSNMDALAEAVAGTIVLKDAAAAGPVEP